MNALENLYSRRSIRSYTGEPVTQTELREILKAAYAAPVGRAMYDSLTITVISNKEYLAAWEAKMGLAIGDPDFHPFYGAPTLILVSSAAPQGQLDNINYSNAAIVVQNMALAAAELGVGACHIWGAMGTLNSDAELLKALELPEGMVPCCAVALGHTEQVYSVREIPENRIRTLYLK